MRYGRLIGLFVTLGSVVASCAHGSSPGEDAAPGIVGRVVDRDGNQVLAEVYTEPPSERVFTSKGRFHLQYDLSVRGKRAALAPNKYVIKVRARGWSPASPDPIVADYRGGRAELPDIVLVAREGPVARHHDEVPNGERPVAPPGQRPREP